MVCLDDCVNFSIFEGKPTCKFYDKSLLVNSHSGVISRCVECKNAGVVGINCNIERINLLKRQLGWLADNFYSFKDDFESNLTDIYRLLKQMEKDDEVEQIQDDEGDK